MSITTAIENISNHLKNAYNELEGLGADLSNVNKNLENISIVLDNIYDNMPQVSGEGTSLTLDNTKIGKIKSILKGNTSQDETPTPSSPIPVNVVSGDNEINICGKNLFNKNTITISAYLKEDGTLQTGAEYITSDFIPVQPNTTYYKTQTLSPRTKFYDANKQVLDNSTYQDVSIGGNEGSFTTPSNAYYFRFTGNVNISTGININNVMVHKGSEATTYEAYTGASYPINLGDIELCKIGDYQDRIYKSLVDGNWYLHKEIGKVVLNGTQGTLSTPSTNRFNIDNAFYNYLKSGNNTTYLCDKYQAFEQKGNNSDFNTLVSNVNYGMNLSSSSAAYTIRFKDTRYTTVEDFQTWLSTHNTEVYYVLATPTNTQITDTTLISQLNAVKNAVSYDTQTNISQENANKPFIINATALIENSD